MVRAGLLWLSEQPRIFRFLLRNGLARRFRARFLAGWTGDSGVAALKAPNAARITASLHVVGEVGRPARRAHTARGRHPGTPGRKQGPPGGTQLSRQSATNGPRHR